MIDNVARLIDNCVNIVINIEQELDGKVWILGSPIKDTLVFRITKENAVFQKIYSYEELDKIIDPVIIANNFIRECRESQMES